MAVFKQLNPELQDHVLQLVGIPLNLKNEVVSPIDADDKNH